MAIATAKLNNIRISPRKARLVIDAVRGNTVRDAIVKLQFLNKRGALPIRKLVESALANAKEKGADLENLIVKKITVDAGETMYRTMPRARGSAYRIRKRTSKISVELDQKK